MCPRLMLVLNFLRIQDCFNTFNLIKNAHSLNDNCIDKLTLIISKLLIATCISI